MKQLRTLADLKKQYVAAMRDLPQVRKILLASEEEGPVFWTIIEAPPFDRKTHDELSRRHQAMLVQCQSIVPDFQVVNVRELSPGMKEDDLIPSESAVLFQR